MISKSEEKILSIFEYYQLKNGEFISYNDLILNRSLLLPLTIDNLDRFIYSLEKKGLLETKNPSENMTLLTLTKKGTEYLYGYWIDESYLVKEKSKEKDIFLGL